MCFFDYIHKLLTVIKLDDIYYSYFVNRYTFIYIYDKIKMKNRTFSGNKENIIGSNNM